MNPPPHAAATTASLLTELAGPILAIAIQLAAVSSLCNPAAIAQPLNVLPRTSSPILTQVALMHLPRVDLNFAANIGDVDLLRFMLKWSKKPGGRPLNFSSDRMIRHAFKQSMDVLDWLADESDLCVDWNALGLSLKHVVDLGDLQKLNWCLLHGHVSLDDIDTVAKAAVYASAAGHVQVLDWILEHVSTEVFVAAVDRHRNPGVYMCAAAAGGHLDVLDWWTNKASLLLGEDVRQERINASKVIPMALERRQIQVLEWCKSHPEAAQQHHATWKPDSHRSNSPLRFAVQFDLLEWIDSLGIVPFEAEYRLATDSACCLGKVDALEWLRGKGYLAGSRNKLIGEAAKAGSVEVLNWIQQHFLADSSTTWNVPGGTDDELPQLEDGAHADPILVACQVHGRIDVLDWLIEHAFMPQESGLFSYFSFASQLPTVDVLNWLSRHAGPLGQKKINEIAFQVGFVNARHVCVLDWWFSKVTTPAGTGVFRRYNLIMKEHGNHERIDLSRQTALFKLDVLQWWLRQTCMSSPLHRLIRFGPAGADLFPTNFQACQIHANDPSGYLTYLKTWLDQTIFWIEDWVSCIHAASINGKLDVLDWFLKVVKTNEVFFEMALTRDCTNENPPQSQCIFLDNHGKSLLWWRAKFPHLFKSNPSLQLNRDHYANPIHANIHESMLKIAPAPLQDPALASKFGKIAMLMYIKRERPELLRWRLVESLVEASKAGFCNILDWWNVHSGLQVECPKQVIDQLNRGSVRTRAKKVAEWWLKSGLFTASGV